MEHPPPLTSEARKWSKVTEGGGLLSNLTGGGGVKQGGGFKQGEGFKHSGTDTPGQLGDPGIRGWVLSRVAGNRESVENQRKTMHSRSNINRQAGRGFKQGEGFKHSREAARSKCAKKGRGGVLSTLAYPPPR